MYTRLICLEVKACLFISLTVGTNSREKKISKHLPLVENTVARSGNGKMYACYALL